MDDHDIRATCGGCLHELDLGEAAVEFVGSITHYACPRCGVPLLVVAPIPGEAGVVGLRTFDGVQAWLDLSAVNRVASTESHDDAS